MRSRDHQVGVGTRKRKSGGSRSTHLQLWIIILYRLPNSNSDLPANEWGWRDFCPFSGRQLVNRWYQTRRRSSAALREGQEASIQQGYVSAYVDNLGSGLPISTTAVFAPLRVLWSTICRYHPRPSEMDMSGRPNIATAPHGRKG